MPSSSIRRLPPPPQTQVLSSTTFRAPPLDGSLTLPEIYDWHLENTPNHRIFTFATEDGTVRDIMWPEAVTAMHVGAKILRERLSLRADTGNTPIVAILASSDTISYSTLIMAVLRANCIVFPISPRNSAAAIAHLISKVNITHILLGQEQSMLDLTGETLKVLQSDHPSTAKPNISPVLLFDDLYLGPNSLVNMDDFPVTRTNSDDVTLYLHSSGSTAFPKPIPWSCHRLLHLGLTPYFGDRDLTGRVMSGHTMPMFHGMGVSQLGWTSLAGVTISAFEPKSPVPVPTPDALFKAAVATNSDIIFCVPTFIEAWSRKPDYVKWLASRDGVMYGGGPLNRIAGDYMTSQGVSIFVMYGSTECGIMSPILPKSVDYDWDHFRFPGNVLPEMVPQGDGTFELIVLPNPFGIPGVVNTSVRGIDAYATSDLLTPHPTKKGYWRIYGRNDDQIMHSTGEKTNPGPLESMLNQDPHVSAAVMFGRGYFQAGVLVDPKPGFKFDPSDESELAEFRNKIWSTVQKMNDFAPQHSRLFKEMIMVAKPSKPFHYTAKNTARRQAILNDYTDEIAKLYDTVDESTNASIPPPKAWDILSTTDFVRTVVNKVLVHQIEDGDDLFEHGCDSLQATWIRNSLLRALRDSARLDTRKSVDNFVYDHPSILRLSHFITDWASGKSAEDADASREALMQAMVDKYSREFPVHSPGSNSDSLQGDVVLVTGTTGALGCYLLAQLVDDPAIVRVYAINRVRRKGQISLLDAQKSALIDRGLDPETILISKKVCLLEADVSIPGFALPEDTFNEIQLSTTHIIHNAWPVDFNLALASFEPNIKGLRNLIDMSLSSHLFRPPKLLFTSSIGLFQNLAGSTSTDIIPETPIASGVASGMGYTESKWVCEQILMRCGDKTPLKPLVVRVGQLSGGLNGAWNTKEWLPSIVHSARIVNCLPTDEKDVSWIPTHTAAEALIDFCKADLSACSFAHLIHPKPVPWSQLASIMADELDVPLVSFEQWLQALEGLVNSKTEASQDNGASVRLLRDVPALRLLSVYKGIAADAPKRGDALGFPKLDATNTLKFSPTLRNAAIPTLGGGDIKAWLGYWRQSRFLV